jgi:hypothetical protein
MRRLFVVLINMSVFKKKDEDDITHKLVVNDPLNEPGWILIITGIIESSLNSCLQCSNVDVFLGFE